jgi:phospholipase/lecithinase/hemolysin
LTVVWSCINPLTAIWNGWQQDGDVSKAHAHIDDNVNELAVQLLNISSNALLRKGVAGADFLLPTCPPLESMPNFFYQASPAGNKAQLAQLAQFRARFEAGMKKSVAALRKQKSFAKSRVVTFDTVAWWKAVMKSPKSYGFVNVKDPCYNTTTGKVCAKPATYFYLCVASLRGQTPGLMLLSDTLHPTTAAFKRLAAAVS